MENKQKKIAAVLWWNSFNTLLKCLDSPGSFFRLMTALFISFTRHYYQLGAIDWQFATVAPPLTLKWKATAAWGRRSLDWHLIECGGGAFDCTSCQYRVIVFLTYIEPCFLCFFVTATSNIPAGGSFFVLLILCILAYCIRTRWSSCTSVPCYTRPLFWYCECLFTTFCTICHHSIGPLRFRTHTRRLD